jgi:hypothetical protein
MTHDERHGRGRITRQQQYRAHRVIVRLGSTSLEAKQPHHSTTWQIEYMSGHSESDNNIISDFVVVVVLDLPIHLV